MTILPAVGFNEIWDENLGGIADSTTWDKSSATVPAGETWVLQCVSLSDYSGPTGLAFLAIHRASGAVVLLRRAPSLIQYAVGMESGNWVLGEGDRVQVYATGIAVDDVIQAGLIGYKMHMPM